VGKQHGGERSLFDYLVPVAQIPFRVGYLPADVISTPMAKLMPLETVLTSLYRDHEVAKPLEVFLQELHESLSFSDWCARRVSDGGRMLAPKVAAAGFEVIDFWQYGSRLHVSIGWASPREQKRPRDRRFTYYTLAVDFRPTPERTLGKGKWVMPVQTIFAHLLGSKLRSLLRGEPQKWFSEEGQQAALDHFKFTKTTLLSRAELKQARIDFVRQHPELHARPRDLATALRDAELYNEHTELHAIVKQLPRMLEAASA
jgi:hypothetical protein